MKTIKQPCSICFIKIKCMKIYTRIRNYKKKGWRNFEIESKELPGKKNLIDRFFGTSTWEENEYNGRQTWKTVPKFSMKRQRVKIWIRKKDMEIDQEF